MPYADNRGTRIHYEVEGEGPPLVLQHGFTGNLRRWRTFGYVDALKSSYRLILVDARGHGASDKPHDPAAYELSLRAGDVTAVLDALKIPGAHYWGYSMGGWIGFGMAKHAAGRVLSLVIGGAHPYEERIPQVGRDGSDPEAFMAALFRRLGVDPASIPPAVKAEMAANDFRALAASQQDRLSLEEILPAMTMPCCLYVGNADPRCAQVLQCARQIRGAVSFVMQGLDHSAGFRESAAALPKVTAFLRDAAKGSRRQTA